MDRKRISAILILVQQSEKSSNIVGGRFPHAGCPFHAAAAKTDHRAGQASRLSGYGGARARFFARAGRLQIGEYDNAIRKRW